MGQGSSMSPGGIPPITNAAPPVFVRVPAKKTGLRIFAVILLILLVLSLIGNGILFLGFAAASGGGGGSSGRVVEDVIRQGGREKVAILPAAGVVDEDMVARVRSYIRAIRDDDRIQAVVLEVDSPGGSITASDEIHHLLTELCTKDGKKLVVSMRSLAASGGYYISMPAETIYAEPTTLTGSIGVIWPAFEMSGLLEKIGIKPEMITSDEAKYKDMASPFKKFTPDDVRYIKDLVNQAHGKFKEVVKTGRGAKLTVSIDEVAIGRIWTADDAKKMGLIDDIAYLDDVCLKAAAAAGITNPTVVRLREHVSLFDVLNGATPARSPKIEISPKLLYDIQTPKMEYRWVPPWTAGQ